METIPCLLVNTRFPFLPVPRRSDGKKKHGWLQGREELKVAAFLLLAPCLEEERVDQG